MAEIARFNGAAIHGEVCQNVVETLMRLLDEAQRGEIVGIAYSASVPNGDTRNGWRHAKGGGHQLSTGILILAHDYARAWTETRGD